MTTATDMFLETVSLNDDAAPSGGRVGGGSATADVDRLESQPFPHSVQFAKNGSSAANPLGDSDDEDEAPGRGGQAPVVVVVESPAPPSRNGAARPTLPPLRVPPRADAGDDGEEYLRDYVDPTLFSAEVSRRAAEIARGRAKTLELELQELAALEREALSPATAAAARLSAGEAVGIISAAFASSLARARQLVSARGKEYDLLSGSSPSSKVDDLDTDGDGLQLSPDSSRGRDGQHFRAKHRPALKRVSAYSSLEKERRSSVGAPPKKRIVWHEDVLDQDEEFVEDDDGGGVEVAGAPVSPGSTETAALMDGGGGSPSSVLHYKNDRLTPRSKKKRKKLVKGMMRRLTPSEKEELYKQRPDLMIIPNWAQKYRQGLEDEESSRWSFWLIAIIGTLAVLLIVLIILIARERAAAQAQSV